MKDETNNQIDRLLRRLSRRENSTARDEQNRGHLDADELSSYAQDALPAATRSRYTEHLAECSTCRRLVTELILALGATPAVKVETVAEPSGLKKFLASFFSPMVLRYAVPVLSLVLIAAVGFVLLRQQRRSELMAELKQPQSQPATVSIPEAPQAAPSSSGQPSAGDRDQLQKRQLKPEATAAPKALAETNGAAPGAPVKNENAVRPVERKAEEPPPPPAAAESVRVENEEQKKEPAAKPQAESVTVKQTTDKEVSTQRANEPVTDEARRSDRVSDDKIQEKRVQNLPMNSRRVAGLATLSPGRAQDKDTTETRSVAGRQFRKQRGIWIDTAYDSSKEPVNVARGSEQFRALVADEPAIRTIAEQLQGEVIVVWKGHTYRIR